jgi:hypothetical protein
LSASASLAELELGFVDRLEGAAAFTALIQKFAHGWPKALLEKPVQQAFPRVTWFTPGRVSLSNSAPSLLEIQTDIWVWRSESDGGLATLNAIDQAMLDLLGNEDSAVTFPFTLTVDDVDITYYLSCACIDASDPPEGLLLRRRRLWQVAEV